VCYSIISVHLKGYDLGSSVRFSCVVCVRGCGLLNRPSSSSASSSPISVPLNFFDDQIEHTEGTLEHETEGNESSVSKVPPPAQAPRSKFARWLERKVRDVPAGDPIRALLLHDVKVFRERLHLNLRVFYMVLLTMKDCDAFELWCLPPTLSQAVQYDYVDARTGVAAYLSEFVSFEDEEFTAFWDFIWDKSGGWFFQAILAFIQGTLAGNSK